MDKDFAPSLGVGRELVDYGTLLTSFPDRLSPKRNLEVEVTGIDVQSVSTAK
jgi:hypothetical protein